MSDDEVLSRKDLKAPDKFQEVATRAVDWISGHKKNARVISIVVAVAGFAGVTWFEIYKALSGAGLRGRAAGSRSTF